MYIIKKCSFFGHRNTQLTEQQIIKLTQIIENLITSENVSEFLFGSNSMFNDACHEIVTSLMQKYPHIIRKFYTCQSESCVLECDRLATQRSVSKLWKEEIKLLGFEQEVIFKNKYTAGRASYVERNYALVDDSDYCIFYCDYNYRPQLRPRDKRCLYYYQPKSGTLLAMKYAMRKKKI